MFVNIFAVAMFIYTATLKITLNEHKVNALDVCLIRTSVMLVGSLIIACSIGAPFFIQPADRAVLFFRSIAGTVGFTSITFGVALVPLVVQSTIFNTAPFWTAILGWLFLNETISRFEVLAMALSFAGVVCIAFSNSVSDESSGE